MGEGVGRIAWTSLMHAESVDEHASVDWTDEHLGEHLVGRTHPDQMPVVQPALEVAGHEQPLSLKGSLNGPGILKLGKTVEQGAQSPLHLLIGVEHNRAIMQ